jgi:hypothetical protein
MIPFLIRLCKKVTDPYPPLPLALLAPQMFICRFCCKIKDPDPHPDPNKKVTDPQHCVLIFQLQDSAAPVKNTGARYVVDEDRLLDLFRLVILLRLLLLLNYLLVLMGGPAFLKFFLRTNYIHTQYGLYSTRDCDLIARIDEVTEHYSARFHNCIE